jgi:hypothetical protein
MMVLSMISGRAGMSQVVQQRRDLVGEAQVQQAA